MSEVTEIFNCDGKEVFFDGGILEKALFSEDNEVIFQSSTAKVVKASLNQKVVVLKILDFQGMIVPSIEHSAKIADINRELKALEVLCTRREENIMAYYGYGRFNSISVVVLENLSGPTLSKWHKDTLKG